MQTLDEAGCRQFVLSQPRPAVLGVVHPDGHPLVTPIWIDLDGPDIVFATGTATLKAVAIRHQPDVSLCVQDDRAPFACVTARGIATLSADVEEVRRWAARLGGRYLGADRAAEMGERNGVPGELLVRVRVTRWSGYADVSS